MDHKRKRRRRSGGSRRTDPVLVSLSALVVMLLVVWGAFYLKDSSNKSLNVLADGGGESLQEEGTLRTWDEDAANREAHEQPSGEGNAVQSGKPEQTPSGTPSNPDAYSPGNTETEAPGEPDSATPGKPATQTPGKPATVTPGKTEGGKDAESPSKPADESPGKPDTEVPDKGTEEPDKGETSTPPVDEAESLVDRYEKKVEGVQAMCEKDLDEILTQAKTSFGKLDLQDPFAVQAWSDNRSRDLEDAGAACDSRFKTVVGNAEKDGVSPNVTAEWEGIFNKKKEEMQGETKTKLEQLIGG